ncbi:hypothetical protein D3C84_896130 [compost metagenome]
MLARQKRFLSGGERVGGFIVLLEENAGRVGNEALLEYDRDDAHQFNRGVYNISACAAAWCNGNDEYKLLQYPDA